MDLRLLGPLQAFENGRAVSVGRGRESALLALLAIHANEALATDRIVDELWGESAPENATKSVQIYVSRLRKSLGNERIETTAGGYLLRLGADELDSARFEHLATTGRRQVEGGDVAVGERTLSEALDLWQGDALSDFRFASFAQDEIRRLEEVRANAVADRVDAELAIGHEDAAVPVLRKLIASQPLWERPRRQLMLALYRSGRQAEALELYRETRALFDEELALEPSPALQDLERRILNQDPELGSVSRLPARRTDSRRGALLVAAGGVLIAAAAAAAVAVVATRGDSGAALTSIASNSLGAIDPSSDRLVGQVALGSSPTAVGVGSRSVWVADANRQQLIAVDPDRLRVQRTVPLASIPTDLAVGRTAVWTTNPLGAASGTVSRVDERTGETRDVTIRGADVADLFAPSTPNALAIDDNGGTWTNTVHGQLVRIQRGQVRDFDIGRGHSIDGIAFGAGSIWIASSVDDTVIRVDPQTGRVIKTINISTERGPAAGPAALAWGYGSIWVADALADRVSRIDPATNTVAGSIAVGTRPTSVAVGAGGVWSLNAGDGSVSHIDPSTRRVVATIPVARVVTGLAAGAHRVWVTVAGGNAPRSPTPPAAQVRPLVTGSCQPMESGGTSPDVLIVSDLPTFDNGGEVNAEIVDLRTAIRAVLKQRNFRAGSYRVGYQACTDSSPGASPRSPSLRFERAGIREGQECHWGGRRVPVDLLRDRASHPRHRRRRPGRHDQPVQHVRRADPRRAADRTGRARSVFPDRSAQLRPLDRAGRRAGRGSGRARPPASPSPHLLARRRRFDQRGDGHVRLAGGAASGRRSGGRRTLEGERPVPDARPYHSRKPSRRGRAHGLCVHERRRARHRPSQGVGRPCCIPGFRQLHLCV